MEAQFSQYAMQYDFEIFIEWWGGYYCSLGVPLKPSVALSDSGIVARPARKIFVATQGSPEGTAEKNSTGKTVHAESS